MTLIAGLKTKRPDPLPKKNVYLLDGTAGSGKTTFCATVGSGNKILVLDFEGGTTSYSAPHYPSIPDATELENIDIIPFPQNGEGTINEAAKLAFTVQGILDHLIKSQNAEGYTVVVLDSLTEFQRRFISTHGASDPRQSYGAWAEAIYSIVHKARACPMDVIFTSRPRVSKDEVSGQDIVRSDVSPAAWSLVSGLIDVAGLLTVKTSVSGKVTRTLDTTHDQRYQAKDRAGIGEMENPSLRQLLDKVSSGGTTTAVVAEPSKPSRVPAFAGKK